MTWQDAKWLQSMGIEVDEPVEPEPEPISIPKSPLMQMMPRANFEGPSPAAMRAADEEAYRKHRELLMAQSSLWLANLRAAQENEAYKEYMKRLKETAWDELLGGMDW